MMNAFVSEQASSANKHVIIHVIESVSKNLSNQCLAFFVAKLET